jgi:putative SbcD/Mre11-related phosphoesterase
LKIKALFEKRAVLIEHMGSEFGSGRGLVVSDLHIGFEEKFKSSGINIQSNVEKMQHELEDLIAEYDVTNLIIAGDVKSGTDRIFQSEWENVPKFLSSLAKKCKVIIVPGNHDGGLSNLVPDAVQIADSNGIVLQDTLIFHGHTKPLIKFKDCNRILMGHIHPIYQKKNSPLSGIPVWIFLKINKKFLFKEIISTDEDSLMEVIVIPTFNSDLTVAGYFNEEAKAERRLSPIVKGLHSASEVIITTLNAEVIGDLSFLPSVL